MCIDGSDKTRAIHRHMIIRLLARITLPYKAVASLTSQAIDRSLPWSTWISLQLHYWICTACVRYRDQLMMIRHTLLRSSEPNHSNGPSSLSPAIKTRLTEAFRTTHQ